VFIDVKWYSLLYWVKELRGDFDKPPAFTDGYSDEDINGDFCDDEELNTYVCVVCGKNIYTKHPASFCSLCLPESKYYYEWRKVGDDFPFYCGSGSKNRCVKIHNVGKVFRRKPAICEKIRMACKDIRIVIYEQGLSIKEMDYLEYGRMNWWLNQGVVLANQRYKPHYEPIPMLRSPAYDFVAHG
jgi:hypothetical protein